MTIANHVVTGMKHVKPGFDQLILFTSSVEELLPRGVWSNYTVERKIRIYYVGMIDGFHKYQLGCVETDYTLQRKANSTADLVKKLLSVFRLLVLGADGNGVLQKIYNFPYLQQEWIEIKATQLIEYDDTDIEKWNLILKMDLLLQNPDAVLNYLKMPNMFGLFFNGYWRDAFPQEITTTEQMYGEEMGNKQFQELLRYSVQETAIQQFIKISIEENSVSEKNYGGSCTFLDGALDFIQKKIEKDSIIFNYSAKWVGLKTLFQL